MVRGHIVGCGMFATWRWIGRYRCWVTARSIRSPTWSTSSVSETQRSRQFARRDDRARRHAVDFGIGRFAEEMTERVGVGVGFVCVRGCFRRRDRPARHGLGFTGRRAGGPRSGRSGVDGRAEVRGPLRGRYRRGRGGTASPPTHPSRSGPEGRVTSSTTAESRPEVPVETAGRSGGAMVRRSVSGVL